MSLMVLGLIGLGAVLLLMFFGMHIGLSMALVGFLGFSYVVSVEGAAYVVKGQVFETVSNYSFTVIPLFVLMGSIAAYSEMSRRLYDMASRWIGRIRGGLAIATIAGCAGFACICGSTIATAATMCKVAFPEMKRYGYKPELSSGCIAAGGTLGILIPPSLAFILYAIMTQESIGKLFIAGIIPGFVLTLLYIGIILFWVTVRPEIAPPTPVVSLREKSAALTGTIDILIVFALVMGGIFLGFFTATEGGAVGAAGVLVITLIRRTLTWKGFTASLVETVRISSMMILIVAGAMIFNRFLAVTRLPYELAQLISNLPLSPIFIMIAILVSYVVLGMVMDTAAMILLTVPIYFPVVVALGFDPIWFGVIVVVMMELGQITPPVGISVFVIGGMLNIPLETIYKGVLTFVLADLALTGILLAAPQLALFLPNLMK